VIPDADEGKGIEGGRKPAFSFHKVDPATVRDSHGASPVENEVLRIRALMEEKKFAEALSAARTLVVRVPENRDVLYLIAVTQRYLQRIPEALAALELLERHHPQFSRLFQERGHCYVALRDAPNAIAAFLRGVNINPALPASWQMLQSLFRMTGDALNAKIAGDHIATLAKLPPEIVTANALFSDGDLLPAEAIVRARLLKHGDEVEAMRLLARIGMQQEVFDDAETLLEAVMVIAPDYRAARHDYALTLLQRHKHEQAVQELEKLMRAEPNNRLFRTTYATALVGLGDHEKALALYRELLVDAPQSTDLHLSVAHSLKTLGRQTESIEAYRAAAAARASYGDAWWSLANLKTYQFSDDEIALMRTEEAADATPAVDRYHLCFALGKALEDRADYAESFKFYERGNALKKSESHFRIEPIERNTRLQKMVFTRQFLAARGAKGCPEADPIFIVGLPRAGSTLVEQILASHSRVEGTMELANIPRIVHELLGRDIASDNPRYPHVLTEMSSEELLGLGRKYLEDTRVYRSGKPFFIDKMPNNFRHVGLIHLILPNAKIIDARRGAMGCCFSNFKQLFASGQEFTYGLEDIGRYYRTYRELMAHWDEVLPGKVLRVQHEDLVEDLDGNVRRLLEFCALEFEPQCLEFYKTERSVRTASSEQVRRPIFKEGIHQWKHFEPWLGPLKQVLGEFADEL
jgi:tetratricopeptide (TPR) repeat protein